MKLRYGLLTWLGLALPSIGAAQRDTDAAFDARFYAQIAHSVFQVRATSAQGGVSMGSAVLVAPGKLVTNCHVTRGSSSIYLVRGMDALRVEAGASDVEHDLCALRAPQLRGPIAQLAPARQLHVGQAVVAIGYSGGFKLSVSPGHIKGLYSYHDAPVVRSDAWFQRGASGGGLFDAQGNLVGVLSFKSTAGDDVHYALPVEWLARLDAPQAADEAQAFWEREVVQQPHFLQAAWLETTRAWTELVPLAQAWARTQSEDAEAWLSLGRALRHSGRAIEAVSALQRALTLDARHPQAWLEIGMAYHAVQQQAEFSRARIRLAELSPVSALRLDALVRHQVP